MSNNQLVHFGSSLDASNSAFTPRRIRSMQCFGIVNSCLSGQLQRYMSAGSAFVRDWESYNVSTLDSVSSCITPDSSLHFTRRS